MSCGHGCWVGAVGSMTALARGFVEWVSSRGRRGSSLRARAGGRALTLAAECQDLMYGQLRSVWIRGGFVDFFAVSAISVVRPRLRR